MQQLFVNAWMSIKTNYYFYGLAFIAIQSFILGHSGKLSSVVEMINVFCYVMSGLFLIHAYNCFKAYKNNPLNNPLSQFLTLLFLGIFMMVLPSFFGMTTYTTWGQI